MEGQLPGLASNPSPASGSPGHPDPHCRCLTSGLHLNRRPGHVWMRVRRLWVPTEACLRWGGWGGVWGSWQVNTRPSLSVLVIPDAESKGQGRDRGSRKMGREGPSLVECQGSGDPLPGPSLSRTGRDWPGVQKPSIEQQTRGRWVLGKASDRPSEVPAVKRVSSSLLPHPSPCSLFCEAPWTCPSRARGSRRSPTPGCALL